jgi:hypothetical protein
MVLKRSEEVKYVHENDPITGRNVHALRDQRSETLAK